MEKEVKNMTIVDILTNFMIEKEIKKIAINDFIINFIIKADEKTINTLGTELPFEWETRGPIIDAISKYSIIKFSLELEAKKQIVDDIANKYLIINARSHIPTWIKIINTDDKIFIEQNKRKEPIVRTKDLARGTQEFYKNSIFEDRILVSQFEPLLIPYDQIKLPLRIRIWSYENKDNKNDKSSLIAFYIKENYINNLKNKKEKISILGRRPENCCGVFPEVEIKTSPTAFHDLYPIENEEFKILTTSEK